MLGAVSAQGDTVSVDTFVVDTTDMVDTTDITDVDNMTYASDMTDAIDVIDMTDAIDTFIVKPLLGDSSTAKAPASENSIPETRTLMGDTLAIDDSATVAMSPALPPPALPKKLRLSFAEKNSGAFKLKKAGGRKSPWVAAICSAVIPGLGQMYNGQYWKPAIVYGGGVAIWYLLDLNLKERSIYDKELNARYYKDTLSLNSSLKRFSDGQLLDVRNYYQNNVELSIIIASAVYLLNILDAVVYAHLSTFDISPNLSMKIDPYARTNFYTKSKMPLDAGLSLSFTFK
jgi:TM2 domain-containing membrane protein YozV